MVKILLTQKFHAENGEEINAAREKGFEVADKKAYITDHELVIYAPLTYGWQLPEIKQHSENDKKYFSKIISKEYSGKSGKLNLPAIMPDRRRLENVKDLAPGDLLYMIQYRNKKEILNHDDRVWFEEGAYYRIADLVDLNENAYDAVKGDLAHFALKSAEEKSEEISTRIEEINTLQEVRTTVKKSVEEEMKSKIAQLKGRMGIGSPVNNYTEGVFEFLAKHYETLGKGYIDDAVKTAVSRLPREINHNYVLTEILNKTELVTAND